MKILLYGFVCIPLPRHCVSFNNGDARTQRLPISMAFPSVLYPASSVSYFVLLLDVTLCYQLYPLNALRFRQYTLLAHAHITAYNRYNYLHAVANLDGSLTAPMLLLSLLCYTHDHLAGTAPKGSTDENMFAPLTYRLF